MIESSEDIAATAPVDKNDCWIWAGTCFERGYGRICIGKKSFYAHRISFEIHHRALLPGELVCHHCDNPPCINPDHLFAGSATDNNRDCIRKGRGNKASGDNHGRRKHPEIIPRGETHPVSKLKEHQVIEIRAIYAAGGISQRQIAEQFGVCRELVSQIVRRVIWQHLT